MSETYELGERVAVKFPIQGLKNRYGTVQEIRQGDIEPEYLVHVHGYRLWCTAIELTGSGS